jgi:hypothetical protein
VNNNNNNNNKEKLNKEYLRRMRLILGTELSAKE